MKKLIAFLLAVVMVLSITACAKKTEGPIPTDVTKEPAASPDEPVDDATEPTGVPFVPEKDYTASDEDVLNNRTVVIATVGDRDLTLGQLQVYYWMSVYGFLQQYGTYAPMFGLDISKSLAEQQCPETGESWQQYFLDMALDTWHSYQTLVLQGEAENSPMDPALQAELDALQTNLEKAAAEGSYANVDEMLQNDVGPGIVFEDYLAYLTVYSQGFSHYNYRCENIEVTDDMIEAYFTENEKALAEDGITKDSKLVNIRHILVEIEGGTEGEDGTTTYTDEEWAACEKDAQAILDQWLAGDATEESFGALAGICTDDPGSKETGGLYEKVAPGDMVEEFDAWCFDESRKVGDYGMVKTTYGYHVMFYSGDTPRWIETCREAVLNEKIKEFVTEATEAYESNPDYSKIMLGNVDLSGG